MIKPERQRSDPTSMQQVICPLSIVPVRKEASDRSEMISQWLYGETADVLERREKWSVLKFHHDGYEGWVDNKQMQEHGPADRIPPVRVTDLCAQVATSGGAMHLAFGAVLTPALSSSYTGATSAQLSGSTFERIATVMDRWLNAPYLWGGRTPMGVDCSGLSQMLFGVSGVPLPRDAWQQAEKGMSIPSIDDALPGDLAFFDNEQGRIVHVGIVLPGNKILHASGRVRIDALDRNGINDQQEGRRTHQLRSLRRAG